MLTVKLPVYQCQVSLERSRLLELFPKSLLTQALQDDPEASEITFENPIVTPESLAILNSIKLLPAPKGIAAVGIYLNIPFLEFMGTPVYAEYCITPDHAFRSPHPFVPRYKLCRPDWIMYEANFNFALLTRAQTLLQHIFDCVPANTYPKIDLYLYQRCIREGQTKWANFILASKRLNL